MALRVRVDPEACRGAQACVRRAPGTFAIGSDGKSRAAAAPADPEEAVRAAAAACPFFAIHTEEAPG